MRFPTIDYDAHPAFAPLAGEYRYDDDLIAEHVGRIDRIHRDLVSAPQLNEADIGRACAQISQTIRAIEEHVGAVGASVLAREWMGASMAWALCDLRYEYFRLSYARRTDAQSGLNPDLQEKLHRLQSDGMCIVDLDEADFRDVREKSLAQLPQLKQLSESNPYTRAVYGPSRISPLGRAIDRALRHAGVLDLLSHYKANRMRILGTGVEYSRAMQAWYRGIYADVGLPDGPLRYLHVDETDHIPKAMIYATEVGEDNGPTMLIPQSNRWERSEFLFRVYKGLDHVTGTRYTKYVPNAEYRVLPRSPELRRIFMQLPRAFRGSSHLGDDILDGTPLAEDLARREIRFVSARGARALVFDGARTLHRGALVTNGERLALQVAFKNTNDRRIRAALGGAGPLRRLWGRSLQLGRMALGR